ncbi:protein kinase [Streptomyces sp. NPDC058611]|uniref:protein kinase domain-containing protein n=1 Tax=unclassified Streptomyces TaxID=2593676 RepID=UPI00365D14E8
MQEGTVLDGRYRLIQSIGAGGFGQVWAAHDPKIDRLVAVKVLTGDASSSRQVARFAREAAVAGGLAHPNIVTVHDFGSTTHNGRACAYLVMELLPGKPLSGALKTGRLPLPKALYVAACVADALKAARGADLTHRDIKPSNIIIRSSGKATVVDCGITKGSDERHDITTTGVLIGTPAYMAPEALAGTFDHRSDLYSLGCVLYEMITGQRPFGGTSWHVINQHLHEQPARLRSLRPDAPPELETLVADLLAKNPADRPPSAGEAAARLRGIYENHFSNPPTQGQNIASEVTLSRTEATNGAVIPLRTTTRKPCPACASRAGAEGSAGCGPCEGTGQTKDIRLKQVRIPAGVRAGQRLRLRGMGRPGRNGGAPGDLYVTVHIA